ncbi:hypothetical protein NLX69_07560 [Rossellomorea sp. BNER]|nr:hypothetical protein [Rossellomorea sp. BNER]
MTGLRTSMDSSTYFHSLWCSADLALHGWLTGALVKEELIDFKIEIIF